MYLTSRVVLACEVTERVSNNMNGPLPREMSLLTNLKNIVMPENKLQGTLEDPFHALSNLITVVLDDNLIDGTIPASLFERNPNLGKLVLCAIEMLNLERKVFSLFSSFICSAVFNIAWNNVTGPIPNAVMAAGKLSHLQVYENKLTGRIPEVPAGSITRHRKL